MKIFSVREAMLDFERLLHEVEAGYEVGIAHGEKLVARLLPPKCSKINQFPDFKNRAQNIWGENAPGSSWDNLLNETRGER